MLSGAAGGRAGLTFGVADRLHVGEELVEEGVAGLELVVRRHGRGRRRGLGPAARRVQSGCEMEWAEDAEETGETRREQLAHSQGF